MTEVTRQEYELLAERVRRLEERLAQLEGNALNPAASGVAVYRNPVAGSVDQHSSDPQVDAQVLQLIRMGRKIEAIKRFRELTGLGLRDAKDAVDEIGRRLGY